LGAEPQKTANIAMNPRRWQGLLLGILGRPRRSRPGLPVRDARVGDDGGCFAYRLVREPGGWE